MRARFNQQIQQPGETVDSFVTALHSLAEHYDYKELRETMIHDRLVAGLLDASLSERLQLEPDLTLQDAIKCARNCAAVKQQQATLRGKAGVTQATVEVNAMQSRSRPHHKQFRTMYLPAKVPTQQGSSSSVIRIHFTGVDGVVRTNIHMSIALPRTLDVDDARN